MRADPAAKSLDFQIPELRLAVFDHLDPVTSTCLGLTCKSFYKIHRSYHSKVRLNQEVRSMDGRRYLLHEILRKWVPPNLTYCRVAPHMFMTHERAREKIQKAIVLWASWGL
jgi:hypothetical protein